MIPFQAARIALLDPELRQHDLLSCHGYNDRIRAYMTTQEDYDEVESLGLHGTTPLRVQDFPVPAEEIRSWMDCSDRLDSGKVSVSVWSAVTAAGSAYWDSTPTAPHTRARPHAT